MSQFDTQIQTARTLILDGSLEDAEVVLNNIIADAKSENRQIKHYQGILALRRGQLKTALALFLEALDHYGPHLFLLLDLAATHYLSGDTASWENCLEKVEFEFRQCRQLISKVSHLKFLLTYAKMREEQGELAKALTLYRDLAHEASSIQGDEQVLLVKHKALAQILRIQSSYQFEKIDIKNYNYLIQVSAARSNSDCGFEVEHSLLSFEIRNFGISYALARFNKISKSEIMKSAEASLIFGDLLYDLMLLNLDIPEVLISQFKDLNNLPHFEKSLLELAMTKKFNLEESLSWPSTMSPSAYLKMMILVGKFLPEISTGKIIHQQLSSLSPASKRIWLDFIDSTIVPTNEQLTFDSKSKTLWMNNASIEIHSEAEIDLLLHLLEAPSYSITDLTQRLWNGSGDESDQARLRMRISRLNKKLTEKFAIKKFIAISKTQVSIQSKLQKSS